jgi:hypothetical protein
LVSYFCENYDVFFLIKVFFFLHWDLDSHFLLRGVPVDPNDWDVFSSAGLAGCVASSVGCKNRLSDLSSCRNQELCPRHAIYHQHYLDMFHIRDFSCL